MFQETKELPVTEVKHLCLFDWRVQVDLAEAAGGFTEDQKAAAAHWDMCAVGEAHRLYGELVRYNTLNLIDQNTILAAMHGRSYPIDIILSVIGRRFGHAVFHNDFASCHHLIDDIELRLNQLEKEAQLYETN